VQQDLGTVGYAIALKSSCFEIHRQPRKRQQQKRANYSPEKAVRSFLLPISENITIPVLVPFLCCNMKELALRVLAL